MKEKPIIFNAEMIRAIQKGIKTQTRRVIKPELFLPGGRGYYFQQNQFSFYNADGLITYYRECPFGIPGDHLWVREAIARRNLSMSSTSIDGATYVADFTPVMGEGPRGSYCGRAVCDWKWKRDTLPGIFMPRWASRITLEVTEVRVEQLQQISYEDIRKEGIEKTKEDIRKYGRATFYDLWNTLNEKRGFGWQSNPWVWVISFQVMDEST